MTKLQYRKQLCDARWLVRRSARLILAGGRCERCGHSSSLNVHHRRYIDGRPAWDYEDELLEVLCRNCHRLQHGIAGLKRPKKAQSQEITISLLSDEYWEWQAKIQEAKAEYFRLETEIEEKRALLDGFDDWMPLVPEPEQRHRPHFSSALAQALLLFGGLRSIEVEKPISEGGIPVRAVQDAISILAKKYAK